MSWRWEWDGGRSEPFGSRQDAEDWMGREWERLLESGVLRATLLDADRRVYTMKLTPD